LGYPADRGLGWQDHTCVKNLPRVGLEVCTKFGRDRSVDLLVKEENSCIGTNSLFHIKTSQPGPCAAREKFNAFFVKQSFFFNDMFRFWSLGYPRYRGLGWQGHTCVKNLP